MASRAESAASADYVVVGSGSAGSALACRLSENGRNTVAVLEFGGSDRGPFIQMPGAFGYSASMARYNWGYYSEPEPQLNNRRLFAPRGKVIGGSSSINGMVYVRGHAEDFNRWEELGAGGWSYADVLPYFKRMEHSHGGEEGWRGTDGPIHVRRGEMTNPLYAAFIEAGRQAGFPATDDYNGSRQEGFGPMEQTSHDGVRWSAANAYLKPALRRPNCRLIRCLARRIVLQGRRAIGVEVEAGGRIEIIRANREVIVAASAFNSPKLLMHSGIGPAEHLRQLGIDVAVDRPGVGQNLQDHLEYYHQFKSTQPITLHSKYNLFWQGVIGAQWLLFKRGLGAYNNVHAAGFIRSAPGIRSPDIQYHFLPMAVAWDGKPACRGHGFQAHVGYNMSKSRGSVTLRSPSVEDAPVLRFNYMSDPDDWTKFRQAIRITREILGQPAFEPYRGEEIQPGSSARTDEELDAFLREHLESAFHPCGTCKMGAADDRMAVVDPETRVIGIEGLRVADSSIFPHNTYGNLNGPSMMTGEKASDHILGKHPLPRSNLQPWINPRWEASDR